MAKRPVNYVSRDFESIKQQASDKALAGAKGKERGRPSSPSKGKGKTREGKGTRKKGNPKERERNPNEKGKKP